MPPFTREPPRRVVGQTFVHIFGVPGKKTAGQGRNLLVPASCTTYAMDRKVPARHDIVRRLDG